MKNTEEPNSGNRTLYTIIEFSGFFPKNRLLKRQFNVECKLIQIPAIVFLKKPFSRLLTLA